MKKPVITAAVVAIAASLSNPSMVSASSLVYGTPWIDDLSGFSVFLVGGHWDERYLGRSWWTGHRSRFDGRRELVEPYQEDAIAPPPPQQELAAPETDSIRPARVAPRHVGPRENRPGDHRFLRED